MCIKVSLLPEASMPDPLRRLLCVAPVAAAASTLAACGSSTIPFVGPLLEGSSGRSARTLGRPDYRLVYGDWTGEQHPVPAFSYAQIDPAFLRQDVAYRGP